MLSYNQRAPRFRRTGGEALHKASILSPRSPCSLNLAERMMKGTQLAPDRFEVPGGHKYRLSDVAAQGQTADFFVALRTAPNGDANYVGIKSLVNGEIPKTELQTMLKVHSPLTGSVVETEQGKYLEIPLCDNVLNQATAQIHAAALPLPSIESWGIDVLWQAAKRLNVMHASNVLHRDIKPANIFVKLDGRIYVGDFGSAADEKARVPLTGSPGFWSPNMLSGLATTRADDVWMLGVSALCMLKGYSLFDPEFELTEVSDADYPKALFQGMRERMNGYLTWRAPEGQRVVGVGRERDEALKADNAAYFGEFEAQFPRLAKLVLSMIDPDLKARPSIDDVYKQLQELRGSAIADGVKDVWAVVTRDEAIQKMMDALDPSKGSAPASRRSAKAFEPHASDV